MSDYIPLADFNARCEALMQKAAELFPEQTVPMVHILMLPEPGGHRFVSLSNMAPPMDRALGFVRAFLEQTKTPPESEETIVLSGRTQ